MTPTGLTDTPDRVLRRLEWQVVRRLDGRLQGNYRTLLQGSGIDVAELREYEPGDDVRHIDWNVTARTDIPHVRTYLEERELTAWLLLDRSASMGFGPVDRPKQAVLAEVAITLARLLARGGNLVGAILYGSQIEQTIAPRTGRNHVLRLTRQLLTPPPPVTPVNAYPYRPDQAGAVTAPKRRFKRAEPATVVAARTQLSDLLVAGLRTIKRRSLVIIASDFISAPGWEGPLALLAQRHEVVAIRVVDPRERDLPDAGLIVVEDAETGELLSVDSSDAAFRARLQAEARRQDDEIEAAARRAQVDLHIISTEDDLVGSLVRIIELRRRRRRR